MDFPSRREGKDALLAFIYLNDGTDYEVRCKEAYLSLADHFDLSEADRAISRDEKYGDGRSEPAWNNFLQYVRRDLVELGYLERNTQTGIWRLSQRGVLAAKGISRAYPYLNLMTPIASDINAAEPTRRIKDNAYRIIRDTALTRRLKKLHQNKCQICGVSVPLAKGAAYSEAHHIKPLGKPHNGPDREENIIIVCPTHHVQCDYWAIPLDFGLLQFNSKHRVSQKYIDYHNKQYAKRQRTAR